MTPPSLAGGTSRVTGASTCPSGVTTSLSGV
ncbi:hypothetical protein A3Q37_04355 [Streptomyces sp. PTY087I2]|nr:hypothetical protein A3Q37_04355 [Streptomyces sp. PTY087I2]